MRDETSTPTMETLSRDIQELKAMIASLFREKVTPEDTSMMISIEEAARISRLSVRTMYNYVSSGKLNVNVTKVGKKVTFKKDDIIRWNVSREFLIPKSS